MRNATRFSGRTASVMAILLGTVAVSGCTEGEGLGFLQSKPQLDTEAQAETTTRLVERDVEAPDVFSATEAGLWDGRPSLGGVWVAHPDVTDPERVIIRNSANGKFVIGALFRKEREIPGPRLQASSDAAQALGMLAGSPVQLDVTALRREEVAPEPTPGVDVAEAPAPAPQVSVPSAVREATLDPIAGAAAAIDATEAPEKTPEIEIATADDTAENTGAAAAPAGRKTWFGAKLFQKKTASVGAPLSALSDTPAAIPASAPVTESALAPAQAKATAKPPAAPAAARKASSLDKPYLQIGIFSVQDNAQNTAAQMRSAGIVPTVYEQSSNGKPFWRVVVGPAQSSSERSSLLKKINGIGFSDAYAVTN